MLNAKYIKGSHVNWIKNSINIVSDVSNFWNGFLRAFCWISRGLSWKVGNRTHVLVGIDHVIGNEDNYILSHFLFEYLVDLGFLTLTHIKRPH